MIYWIYVDGRICSSEMFDYKPSQTQITHSIQKFAEKHGISTSGITVRRASRALQAAQQKRDERGRFK